MYNYNNIIILIIIIIPVTVLKYTTLQIVSMINGSCN